MNEAAQIGTDSTERCLISMDSKSLTANKEAVAADRVFKMNERKREAQEGLADYQARERAVDQKTARLRALRMARDAQGAAPAPIPKKTKRSVSTSNLPRSK